MAVFLLIVFARGWDQAWVVAMAGALPIFGIAWNIIVAAVHTTADADGNRLDELGLAIKPGAADLVAEIAAAERTRAPIDRAWTLSFIATLFAIHIGRMSTDLTLLGLLSPAVAVAGDMVIAVLFTLLVINPAYLVWRDRRAASSVGSGAGIRSRRRRHARWIGSRHRRAWLRWRLTMAIRMREVRYSVPAALDRGCSAACRLPPSSPRPCRSGA